MSVHAFTTSGLIHTHTRPSQANKSEELYFGYTNIYILPFQSVLIPLNASSDICPVHRLLFPPCSQGRTASSSLGIRGRDDPVCPALIQTEQSLSYPSNEQAPVSIFTFLPTLHYIYVPPSDVWLKKVLFFFTLLLFFFFESFQNKSCDASFHKHWLIIGSFSSFLLINVQYSDYASFFIVASRGMVTWLIAGSDFPCNILTHQRASTLQRPDLWYPTWDLLDIHISFTSVPPDLSLCGVDDVCACFACTSLKSAD